MGLPLFVEPTEPNTASKSAEKSTAGPRSSIRRTRTIRGPTARLAHAERRRRWLGAVDSIHEDDPQRPAYIRPGYDASSSAIVAVRPGEELLPPTQRLGRIYYPGMPLTDEPLMPPVPESRDYSSTTDRQNLQRIYQVRQDLRRMARRRPTPTPPYTETDLAFISRMSSSDPPHQSSTIPSTSPDDAELGEDDLEQSLIDLYPRVSRSRQALAERVATLNRINIRSLETSNQLARQARRLDGLSERINGLGDRSIDSRLNSLGERINDSSNRSRENNHSLESRPLDLDELDGLGDRDRSLSPEGGGAWDTLLTSITPDPQPPSVGSSFASSNGTVVASSNSQPTTNSTSMTILAGEGLTVRDCDILSDQGSTDLDEDDMYELRERRWRSYADVVTARDNRGNRGTSGNEPLEGDASSPIVVRLVTGGTIPDEWWVQYGLARHRETEPTS